jgi:hypothetical protein
MIEAEGVQPLLTDRRNFLQRAATFLAVGAAGTTTAIVVGHPAPAAAVLVQEDPAIVALGERIEPLLLEYRIAAADRAKARANAEANCPAVPEEIVCEGTFFRGCAEDECDVEGRHFEVLLLDDEDGGKYAELPRRILSSKKTKEAIARGNLHCNRRTKFGKKLVRMIETAEKYEAERDAVIEATGLPDAMARQCEAGFRIEKLAYEVGYIEPRTIAGVLVQARVLAAYAEVEVQVGHYRGRSGQLVGLPLAQSIMRLSA